MLAGTAIFRAAAVLALATAPRAIGGPFSAALNDPLNACDAPVPGFTGPHGTGKARIITGFDEDNTPIIINPDNYVNPLFFAWAESVLNYQPSEPVSLEFRDPQWALGSVTGDHFFDVVSLGEMTAMQIANEAAPGSITLRLARPVRDLTGADLVVFENGIVAGTSESGAVVGQVFGELAFVEVSNDGENFVRFPATSLTTTIVGPYGSINATDVRNLAGKHANANGESWGTPFDLAQVGLSEIQYIRIVDIPGSGAFTDLADRPVYDPWTTFGSGGFDLEAVGAISSPMTYGEWPQLETLAEDRRGESDDADGDGLPNLLEYAFGRLPGVTDGSDNLPVCRMIEVDGQAHAAIEFVRDERLIDLIYEVQTSASLAGNGWTTIAQSVSGGVVQAVGGHSPVIAESSASPVASIGVLRKVSVSGESPVVPGARRFFRVKVSITPSFQP